MGAVIFGVAVLSPLSADNHLAAGRDAGVQTGALYLWKWRQNIVTPSDLTSGREAEYSGVAIKEHPGVSIDAFESLLEEGYVGTFDFYRRLSEPKRKEVFAAYRGGASLDEVREKVIDLSFSPD